MFNLYSYFKNKYYRNKEMVKYWKTSDSVKAKLTVAPEGHYVLMMEGEKYPFPGYPRGVLLHGSKPGEYGKLSILKHHIKNLIFNQIWEMLEKNEPEIFILDVLNRQIVPKIFELAETMRYDMLPYERLVPAMKEFWRAMSVVEAKTGSRRVKMWKEILCFIFQEDDAYRMRFQWMVKVFNPSSLAYKLHGKDHLEEFGKAFDMLEQAEVVGDMKERVRLWKRGFMFMMRDPNIRSCFIMLCEEMDWNKLKLSKADKYFFRGKYFKVDYPEYQY